MKEKPKITARFFLEQGKPDFNEVNGKRHYRIRLQLANAPSEAKSVTYELDDSYYDSTRQVKRGPTFEEELTSYGDYDLLARIRNPERADVIAERLSTALERGHTADTNDALKEALEYIKNH